ncbi:MAG: phenylalanine--tRNA ligase subunit beta [archaeon]|nr:phenylalanine--tRNA ligase subunit beta [archaeon]
MATAKFPRVEIEKHIKLTPENLERIMLLGIPISLQGEEVEIEITPNRPDLLSMQGFLRMIKTYLKEPGLKKYKVNPPEKNFRVKIDSSVKEIRPFTACAIVKNLKFDDIKIKEIIDLQEKLHTTVGRNRKKLAIGIYPLEKITLPIIYEARAPEKIKFRPLEAEHEMTGLEILQKHPTGKEHSSILNGFEKFPVFVDAKGNILSMPPIINSHETGKITRDTKEVFIECSGFDFATLKKTLNIIVTTFADMNGKIYAMELQYEKKEITPDLNPEKIKLSLDNANKLLGLDLRERDLEKLLPKMGYEYSNGIVKIPAWRIDILHEVDIIEDIAIAYGYDKLIPEIPKVATIGEESKKSRIKSKISEILIGAGLIETSSYHLIKDEEAKKANLKENEKIEVEDSKTDYKLLRPNLLIPTLRMFAENKDHEYPQKIFEIGTSFTKDMREETQIKESENLIIASSPANFTEIKGIMDYLARILNIEYKLKEASHKELIDGRSGAIIFNNKQIGYIGEVHPQTLKDWNIKMPLSIIEISLEEIFNSLLSSL